MLRMLQFYFAFQFHRHSFIWCWYVASTKDQNVHLTTILMSQSPQPVTLYISFRQTFIDRPLCTRSCGKETDL